MYREFVEEAKKGRIVGYRCECGKHTIREICPFCGSRDLEKEIEPEEGRVITCTKIFVAPKEFSSEAPYTVALVELSNGMRLMVRVEREVEIGKEVRFSGVKESALGLSLLFEAKGR